MTIWYENGIVQKELHFVKNEKVGIWKYWSMDGKLIKEEVYENDSLKRTIEFPLTELIDLIGCWTDSREENTDNSDVKVFRRCDYKLFPVSRFRFKIELKEGGICSWLYLAPNDAHHMKNGTWTFDNKNATLKIFDLENQKVKSFVVDRIDEDILHLKR